jgi:uncharacterized protein
LPSLSSVLDSVKPAPVAIIVAFVAGHIGLKAWFFSAHYYDSVAWPLTELTRGAVTPVVLAAAFQMLLLVGGVMLLAGRLRWRDLGLKTSGVLNACLVLLLLWGVVHVIIAAHGLRGCCPLDQGPLLRAAGPVAMGRLLDAFWGSGFIEEVMYRGFLLPQVYLLARRCGMTAPKALVLALVSVQLYFGLNHIPAATRMHMDLTGGTVYIVHAALVGGLFAALYLRTGNLFVAIGAHALVNNPVALYVAGPDPALLMLIGACVLLLAWPVLHRALGDVFTLAGDARTADAMHIVQRTG